MRESGKSILVSFLGVIVLLLFFIKELLVIFRDDADISIFFP